MTLDELYDEIRDEILHRSSLTEERLLRQINLVHAEIQKGIKLPMAAERLYWRCQKMTSGTVSYPANGASVTIATNCRKVRHVSRVLDDGGTVPIEGASEEEVERMLREKAASRRAGMGGYTIIARWYSVGQTSVGLYPSPEEALNLSASYYGMLPNYIKTGETPVTTDWFLEEAPLVLAWGVAAKMAVGQRDAFAATARAEFNTALMNALDGDAEEEKGENATIYRPPLRGSRFER